MLCQPLLDPAHHGVRVRLASNEAGEVQLALAVPFQKIDFGDAERLAGAAVPRNDVQSQIVPGGRPSGSDNAPARIGDHEVRLWVEPDLGKTAAEQILISPM